MALPAGPGRAAVPAVRALTAILVALLAVCLGLPARAVATFPGVQGDIAFVRAGDIWAASPDGTSPRPLTVGPEVDASPRWAPDGRSLVFDRGTVVGRVIHTLGDAGGAPQPLRAGEAPAWSPSGSGLVYVDPLPAPPCVPPACRPLSSITLPAGTATPIPGLGNASSPDWAPKGDWIAYETPIATGAMQIHVTSPSGAAIDYAFRADQDTRSPSWSPDGTRLAFVTSPGPGHVCYLRPGPCLEDPQIGLTVMNADGTGRAVIATGDARDPAWSPDGSRLAYVSAASGTDEIWTMGADGSAPVQITIGGGTQPDWQPRQPLPIPVLQSLAPDSASAGSGVFSLTVRGTGFQPGSVVRWNGVDRPTAFVSSVELTAQIDAADVAGPGTAQVTVSTGPPGGGLSEPKTFTVTALGPAGATPPLAVAPPQVTGAAGVGGVLSCSPGAWAGASSLTWQWLRDGAPIAGATSTTYAPTPADVGLSIACRVLASNGGGASASVSAAVVPAAGVPPPPKRPSDPGPTPGSEQTDSRQPASTPAGPPLRFGIRARARMRAGELLAVRVTFSRALARERVSLQMRRNTRYATVLTRRVTGRRTRLAVRLLTPGRYTFRVVARENGRAKPGKPFTVRARR
ncbi:MAG: hypothetical protein QOD86_1487 [Miltoncostaeaceae bacterium]|nr:hypothetical protein [Miltoncostaeaceae bacterium]